MTLPSRKFPLSRLQVQVSKPEFLPLSKCFIQCILKRASFLFPGSSAAENLRDKQREGFSKSNSVYSVISTYTEHLAIKSIRVLHRENYLLFTSITQNKNYSSSCLVTGLNQTVYIGFLLFVISMDWSSWLLNLLNTHSITTDCIEKNSFDYVAQNPPP